MPSYISHAIMGEDLYKKAYKDEKIFKINISEEELKGYSLGIDLSLLSKNLLKDPQNFHTREFFINMLKYIKENKLIEKDSVISLLYGHIAHYFLDINTHPFIYYIETGCQKAGIISNHNLVEGYLSSYLANTILGKDIMEIKADYFNHLNLSDEEISKLLNNIYGELYGDYQITRTYRRTISIFNLLENIIKSGLFSKDQLIKLSKFNKFLEINNLTFNELVNKNHNIYKNPITGEKHSESFLELYDKSIEMTLEAILLVNKYLYSNSSIEILETVFTDLSYDTGVSCSKGQNYKYVRKK
jgi:hypothetical protein